MLRQLDVIEFCNTWHIHVHPEITTAVHHEGQDVRYRALTRVERYESIKDGLLCLERWRQRHQGQPIYCVEKIILAYLSWIDVARLSGGIDYDLWDIVTHQDQPLFRQIFITNSQRYIHTSVTKYCPSPCPSLERLRGLRGVKLLREAFEFARFPRISRFLVSQVSLPWVVEQVVFHPYEPLCVVTTSSKMLYVIAYDSEHSTKMKHPTGLVYVFGEVSHDYNLNMGRVVWAPGGQFFSLWVTRKFELRGDVHPQYEPLVTERLATKSIIIFSYDSDKVSVRMVKIRFKENTPRLVHSRMNFSPYIWSGTSTFYLVCEYKLIKILLWPTSERLRVQVVEENLFAQLRRLSERAWAWPRTVHAHGFVANPAQPSEIFYASNCVKINHYHARMLIYNADQRRTTHVLHIPGLIQYVVINHAYLVIGFGVYDSHSWSEDKDVILQTTEDLNYFNCPFECKFSPLFQRSTLQGLFGPLSIADQAPPAAAAPAVFLSPTRQAGFKAEEQQIIVCRLRLSDKAVSNLTPIG